MRGIDTKAVNAAIAERIDYLKRVISYELSQQDRIQSDRKEYGYLSVMRRGNGYQYYCRSIVDEKKRLYLSSSKTDLIRELAQNDYDQSILDKAVAELELLQSFIRRYDPLPDKLEDCYRKLSEGRKQLVKPTVTPSELYAARWQAVEYKHKDFREGAPVFITARGEKVRSKSEVIIADALDRNGLYYRYEYPLILPNGKVYHPDFNILEPRNREEYYWEHLGMLGKGSYMTDNLIKLDDYASAGILPGKNLILTFESDDVPLNTETVNGLIRAFFG